MNQKIIDTLQEEIKYKIDALLKLTIEHEVRGEDTEFFERRVIGWTFLNKLLTDYLDNLTPGEQV